ncbi:hypothetical protein [Hyphobacterium marinum]|uniref:Uncharacterized protein n=1 Tax=Hyphobacterium marinum TaxID=3116574 RepID=A0ABU7LVQ9_9PROT|nr:hypothetical protein [Hyphobacterium sp. Y6023]MEE2565614.1 hypothetical protein [Hyphobacterium sp. Y6023]
MRPSRTRLIELIVAVSVVVISVASLFIAWFQGRVMQQTLEASVLPVIQYGSGNYDLDREEWRMTLVFRNTGIGPAELRSLRMTWDGETISDTSQFLARCCVPAEVPPAERHNYVRQAFVSGELAFLFDDVEGRFFAPQEEVEFITSARPDAETQPRGHALWTALDEVRHEIDVEICYCSVFDDCWLARFPGQSRERVDRCPDPTFSRN